MKTLKRFSAILIAVLMMVAMMAVPASAAPTHSITISNADNHEFTAYQIFTGDLSGAVLSNIVWGDGVNPDTLLPALKAADARFTGCATAADVALVLEASTWTEADTIAFAKIVAAHLAASQGTGTAGSSYVISDLEPGYYIVIDTTTLGGANDANSRYIISVTKNTAIEIKKAVPTLGKTVSLKPDSGYSEAVNAAISNTVYFALTATMHARVSDYDTFFLQFEDTLPSALEFVELVSAYVNSTSIDKALVSVDSTGSTLKFTVADAKSVISNATGGAQVSATDTLTVVFSASVTGNGMVYGGAGNTNSAELHFSNNPNDNTSQGTTSPDTAKVYSYQLVVNKTDATTNAKLAGAQFVVKFLDDNGNTKFVKATGSNGNYTVESIVDSESDATLLTTSADGQFILKGLRQREYHLIEKVAPEGYNKIPEADEQKVTITPTLSGDKLTALNASRTGAYTTLNGTDKDAGSVTVTIINHQGATLPSTGGIGTTIFYCIGGLLVIGALALLTVRKRSTAK